LTALGKPFRRNCEDFAAARAFQHLGWFPFAIFPPQDGQCTSRLLDAPVGRSIAEVKEAVGRHIATNPKTDRKTGASPNKVRRIVATGWSPASSAASAGHPERLARGNEGKRAPKLLNREKAKGVS
jgi:hypothetical protein